MNEPLVSVIIPVFNGMKFLPTTVESVKSQTYGRFEAIIINDGSTDNIVDYFGTINDERFRLINQENMGLAATRNTGIKAARGDLIALLDADDLWAPQKISKQVELLQSDPDAGVCYCWMQVIDVNGIALPGRLISYSDEGNVWSTLLVRNIVGSGSTPLVRKECFKTAGLFDESLRCDEDRDMWIRVSERYTFRVVREALVQYRAHDGNLSKNWQVMIDANFKTNRKALSKNPYQLPPGRLTSIIRESEANLYFRSAWAPLKAKKKDIQSSLKMIFKGLRADPSSLIKARFYKPLLFAVATAGREAVNAFAVKR